MCELEENVICMLCGDYLVDAVTLTECLHFFCRSCLLDHLKKENRCPKCFQDLGPDLGAAFRRDDLLQRFVYKLVPDVLWRELQRRRRRDAARQRRGGTLSSRRVAKTRKIAAMARTACRSDERISLVVEYVNVAQIIHARERAGAVKRELDASDHRNEAVKEDGVTFRRYFRCPPLTKIEHLRKLFELKLTVTELHAIHFVDERLSTIFDDELSLQELIGMSGWDRKQPFRILFTLARQTPFDEEEDRPPVLDVEAPQVREHITTSTDGSTNPHDIGSANPPTSINTPAGDGDGTPPAIPRLSITLSTSALTGRTTPGAYHPIITTMQANASGSAPSTSSSGVPSGKSRKRRNGIMDDKTSKSSKTNSAKSSQSHNATATQPELPTTANKLSEAVVPRESSVIVTPPVGTSANKKDAAPPAKKSVGFTKQQPPQSKDTVVSLKPEKTNHQQHSQQHKQSQPQRVNERPLGSMLGSGSFALPLQTSPAAMFQQMMNSYFASTYPQMSPTALAAAAAAVLPYSAAPTGGSGAFLPLTPTTTNSLVVPPFSPHQWGSIGCLDVLQTLNGNSNGNVGMYNAADSMTLFAASYYKHMMNAGLLPPATTAGAGGNTPKPPSPKKSRKDGPVQRLSSDGVPIPPRSAPITAPTAQPRQSLQQMQSRQKEQQQQQKCAKKFSAPPPKSTQENADEFIDVQSMDSADEATTTVLPSTATALTDTVVSSAPPIQKVGSGQQNSQKSSEQSQNRPKPTTTTVVRSSAVSISKVLKPPTASFDVNARFLSAISSSASAAALVTSNGGGTAASKPTLAS